MKKIIAILILLASVNSFAVYFDIGLGFGGAASEVDNIDVGDMCRDCDEIAVLLNLRVGGKIAERVWLAGAIEALGDRYYNSEAYLQFNSYLLGPSVIFYPVEHFHLSGSVGIAWTANDTDLPGFYVYDGSGWAFSLTAAYDTGINTGALIGAKLFSSSVTLDESNADLSSLGFGFFIAFVMK